MNHILIDDKIIFHKKESCLQHKGSVHVKGFLWNHKAQHIHLCIQQVKNQCLTFLDLKQLNNKLSASNSYKYFHLQQNEQYKQQSQCTWT